MAIVLDPAREDAQKNAHNTTYQNGNDAAGTPTPTWLKTLDFYVSTVETHIPFAYDTGVDNTLDSWVPVIENVWLASTPATVR